MINKLYENNIVSISFKAVLVIFGLALLWFYGILFIAALVNLPASWMGLLYTSVGIGAGISCFICLKKNSKILLIYIGIAVLLMAITLSGIFK
jgi:hypothetical protein